MPLSETSKRACDACKSRKVKCDGSSSTEGCSNCRMSSLRCRYLKPTKKRGRKPRASVNKQQDGHHHHPPPDRTKTVLRPRSGTSTRPSSATRSTPRELNSDYISLEIRSHQGDEKDIHVIHEKLVLSLGRCVPIVHLDDIVSQCIHIFMKNVFPNGFMVDENQILSSLPLQPVPKADGQNRTTIELLPGLRNYALITALCASAAYMMFPDVPTNDELGNIFLQASRDTLGLYQSLDFANPVSTSIIVRLLIAGVLHTQGKFFSAIQVHTEATELARNTPLYQESLLNDLDPVEAQIRRNIFWQLYVTDKYCALIEERPMLLHEFCLEDPPVPKIQSDPQVRLMCKGTAEDEANPSQVEFEKQLQCGLFLIHRLWHAATEIVLEIWVLQRMLRRTCDAQISDLAHNSNLMALYLDFIGIIDTFSSLQERIEKIFPENVRATSFNWQQFLVQKANFLVSYHTLKLVLLQRFVNVGVGSLVGITGANAILGLRKTEIAYDLMTVITTAPIESLKANGECFVAKVRHVGVVLLELIGQTEYPEISHRAKSLCCRILDVLARLDSRATETLYENL